MTEQEKQLFSLYGKLPKKKTLLDKATKDRKFFDSLVVDYPLFTRLDSSAPQW